MTVVAAAACSTPSHGVGADAACVFALGAAGIITSFIDKYRINQLYIIGGDGTHRGADAIYKACSAKKLPVVVCGLPKTIDNVSARGAVLSSTPAARSRAMVSIMRSTGGDAYWCAAGRRHH